MVRYVGKIIHEARLVKRVAGELVELSGGEVKQLVDMEIEHDDVSAKDVAVFVE